MKETFFMSLSPVVVAQGKRMAHGDVPGTGEELFLTDIQQGFKLETSAWTHKRVADSVIE
jgi:hypothetical protein